MVSVEVARAHASLVTPPELDGGYFSALPGGRAIAALSARSCRWPLGAVADEGFRFCGQPRTRQSYCAAHASMSRRGAHR